MPVLDQMLTDAQSYEFIFRSTSDGIIVVDTKHVISQVNPAGAGMLGITREEAIGKRPEIVFHQNPVLVNLFIREGDQTFDVRLPRRRLAVGIASTLDTGERLLVLHDITERRELEDRRESLIKTMSHDLRNPISAITGFADLVVKFGELNDQQTKFMTRIRQTSTKLYDVLGSMVDLAWIEAGMPLQHRPIQLRDVINDAVERASSLAHEKKIILVVSVQNPMPTVMGDPKRLEQVVYNLIHNGIIYSPPEKPIVIHAWGDSHDVYCSVADRGIGIADNELALVFDRMWRSSDEEIRNMHGGGLGLTLAKTIINRHGGDLWVASNIGEGSTFTFLLPTVEI
jgi:signal transduction histidine kinase